jgi:DedD protein
MERQKIFWVVLSVSVFVVIVLVVGVFLLRQHPGSQAQAGTVSPLSGNGAQVYEYQKEPSASGAVSSTTGAATSTTGQQPSDQQTLHFYIGEGGNASTQAQPQQPAQPSDASPAGTPATTATTAIPTTVTPPPAATPKTRVAAGTRAPAVRAPVQTRPAQRGTEYWIQTGSYKSQSKAEELATLLGNKGLTGHVFSATSKSDTFYRVRIGPYMSKGEAEKFLGIVKQLEGLEASFISQVGAAQKVRVN